MDTASLIRNPERVSEAFLTTDNMLIAKELVKIYIPVRYETKRMANIGSEIFIPAVFGVVVQDKYTATSLVMSTMRIEPDEINTVKVEDEGYYEFVFHPGSVITPEVNLAKNEFNSYQFYELFPSQGYIPWFIGPGDLSALFGESKYYTGLQAGSSGAVMEIIISSVTRSPENESEYYRHYLNRNPTSTEEPSYIGVSNVVFSTNNTAAKIVGNYFDDSIASALFNPSERVESVEALLRK